MAKNGKPLVREEPTAKGKVIKPGAASAIPL